MSTYLLGCAYCGILICIFLLVYRNHIPNLKEEIPFLTIALGISILSMVSWVGVVIISFVLFMTALKGFPKT